jgi:hypothetical protein
VDTFSETHLNRSACTAGSAATEAEKRKVQKYRNLAQRFQFEPIAIETMGSYGQTTSLIIKELCRRLVQETGDQRESLWFQQRLSLAVQRGNAFSILTAERTKQRDIGAREF